MEGTALIRAYRGQEESASSAILPSYDPSCYLCPSNKRAQGGINPQYENTFVFVNDYSAVKQLQEDYQPSDGDESMGPEFHLDSKN